MRTSRVPILLACVCALLLPAVPAGCALGAHEGFPEARTARAARDAPERFLVGRLEGSETSEPVPGDGCRNPMVDPRDGTRLRLVRSAGGRGDYAPPPGRYGVGEAELLRLDCGTGAPIGVVSR